MLKKLIVIGVFLEILNLTILGANWLSVPPHLRTAPFEAKYENQISRLHEVARDSENQWNATPEICVADWALFDLPEILHASIETSPRSHKIVGNRSFDKRSKFSWINESSTYLGQARHWYTMNDGSKISAVRYTDSVKDVENRTVKINLVIKIADSNSDSHDHLAIAK